MRKLVVDMRLLAFRNVERKFPKLTVRELSWFPPVKNLRGFPGFTGFGIGIRSGASVGSFSNASTRWEASERGLLFVADNPLR